MSPPLSSPSPPSSPFRALAGWLVWGAPLLIVMTTLAVAALSGERLRGDRIAAVFPPWWPPDRVLAAALEVAPISGVGRFPFIVAVSGRAPQAAARLRAAGALLLLDGARFRFCLSS